ncbi:hypothetical protein LXA43DRAFT_1104100 [Ganoderma leucocontextum]|nr:hypothetical protein LXA43DRAFT_1104100 [Ganoderma leucocontextum]
MPPSVFAPKERDFLVAKMQEPYIRDILRQGARLPDGSVNHYLRKAADAVEKAFRERFTGPDEGEKEGEFAERSKRSHHSASSLRRREAETQDAWVLRMGKLNKRIHTFITQQHLVAPNRKSTSVRLEVPAMNPPRKPRTITGMDVFQGGIEVEHSDGKYPVGPARADASKVWKTMSPDQRAPYEEQAQTRNDERAAEEAIDPDTASDRPLDAKTIAIWLKKILERLGMANWGGFICIGGPDANGETRTFIDFVGENRMGHNFLEVFNLASGWSPDQLEALFNVWLEQSKKEVPAIADDNPDSHVWHVIRNSRLTSDLPSQPGPEGPAVPSLPTNPGDAPDVSSRTHNATPTIADEPIAPEPSNPSASSQPEEQIADEPVAPEPGNPSASSQPEEHMDIVVNGRYATTAFGWGERFDDLDSTILRAAVAQLSLCSAGERFDGVESVVLSPMLTNGTNEVVSSGGLPDFPISDIQSNAPALVLSGVDTVDNPGAPSPGGLDAPAQTGKSKKKRVSRRGHAGVRGTQKRARERSPAGVAMPDANGAEVVS